MLILKIIALTLSISTLYFMVPANKSSKLLFRLFIIAFIISAINLIATEYVLSIMWVIIMIFIYISYKAQKSIEENREWEQD